MEHDRMTPSVGRTVHYRLSADDVRRIREKRAVDTRPSYSRDTGNVPVEGDVVPLVIVRVWPDEFPEHGPSRVGRWTEGEWREHVTLGPEGVNGQAILDGNDSLWVCSASQGPNPGQWIRPPVVH